MSWLLRDGEVLAAIEPSRRGWPRRLEGAVILYRPALVQTVTNRTAMDVAWCSTLEVDGRECLEVRRLGSLRPGRIARPRLGAGCVIAAGWGCFERWGLHAGDRLEIRGP